jgi:hypothetical protein
MGRIIGMGLLALAAMLTLGTGTASADLPQAYSVRLLPAPTPGARPNAYGIGNDGTAVGTELLPCDQCPIRTHVVVWPPAGEPAILWNPADPYEFASAVARNDRGDLLVQTDFRLSDGSAGTWVVPTDGRNPFPVTDSETGVAINDSDVVVGNELDFDPYRWSPEAGYQKLRQIPGVNYSYVDDVNDAGVAVGFSGGIPVYWNPNGSVHVLHTPGTGVFGEASAILDTGVIYGLGPVPGDTVAHLIRWDRDGVPHDLGNPAGSVQTTVDFANADGTVVGSYVAPHSTDAFVYSNGRFARIRDLVRYRPAFADFHWMPTGLNDSGLITSNQGPAAVLIPATVTENTGEGITFTGSWHGQSGTGFSGGSTRYTTQRGASASFAFHGDSIEWVSQRGPARGQAAVSVDGGERRVVDLHRSATQSTRVVFTLRDLGPGSHTITIANLATPGHPRIDVDAFQTTS